MGKKERERGATEGVVVCTHKRGGRMAGVTAALNRFTGGLGVVCAIILVVLGVFVVVLAGLFIVMFLRVSIIDPTVLFFVDPAGLSVSDPTGLFIIDPTVLFFTGLGEHSRGGKGGVHPHPGHIQTGHVPGGGGEEGGVGESGDLPVGGPGLIFSPSWHPLAFLGVFVFLLVRASVGC